MMLEPWPRCPNQQGPADAHDARAVAAVPNQQSQQGPADAHDARAVAAVPESAGQLMLVMLSFGRGVAGPADGHDARAVAAAQLMLMMLEPWPGTVVSAILAEAMPWWGHVGIGDVHARVSL
eukprot:s1120_g10.t1